jgi:hypothetical protein
MYNKHVVFVVILALVVALVCGSFTPFTPFIVYAEPPEQGWLDSKDCTYTVPGLTRCCWTENKVKYCQVCTPIPKDEGGGLECTTKEKQSLEQPPTPQPFDPTAPLQGGVLEQPPSPPPSGPVAPLKGGILEQLEQGNPEIGFSQQQQQLPPPAGQGAAELPPPATTEGTQPATVEEEQPVPVCQEGLEFNEDLGFCVPENCPEGQELNEDTGICVLEEQPAAEVPEEQQQTEEAQPGPEEE